MQLFSSTHWSTIEFNPLSFIFVWTRFEHKVQDMYVSQNGQVLSSLEKPETHVRYQQGPQRSRALTGAVSIIQNTETTVHEVNI